MKESAAMIEAKKILDENEKQMKRRTRKLLFFGIPLVILQIAFFIFLLMSLPSCVDVNPYKAKCNPGIKQECVCFNGKTGTQFCNVTGTEWTKCVGCHSQMDGGIETDAFMNLSCVTGSSICEGNNISTCSSSGVFKATENCSKKQFGDKPFICDVCNNTPTCLPRKDLFSGEISGFINFKYDWRTPSCRDEKNKVQKIESVLHKKSKKFTYLISHDDFDLWFSVDSMPQNLKTTFFGDLFEIVFDNCTNKDAINEANKPSNTGVVEISFTRMNKGGHYTIKMDGELWCNNSWKPFKFAGSGHILVAK